MARGNGGIIGPPNTVTNGCAACGVASGVWQMNTVYSYVKNSDWVYNFSSNDYLLVGGGGAGFGWKGGGAGAGGMVTSHSNPCAASLAIKWGTYPVSVGGGGSGGAGGTPSGQGDSGTNSSFETITAYGGSGGMMAPGTNTGGGSGGGGRLSANPGAAGNTPAVPTALGGPQGNTGGTGGGTGPSANSGGGGGGAGGGGTYPSTAVTQASGGKGVVVLRTPAYVSTDSVCAPVNYSGSDYVATFKASANITLGGTSPTAGSAFDYLVIAGGGSGGNAGGGGAGGYRTSFPGGTKLNLNPGCHTVAVGSGAASPGSSALPGLDGGNSIVGNIVSTGGGGGASSNAIVYRATGKPGGSGGGGSYSVSGATGGKPGGCGNAGGNTPVEGYDGGDFVSPTAGGGGGGGGGASAVGGQFGPAAAPAIPDGGAGGNGLANSITGASVTRGGGGGGNSEVLGGCGGTGGGGNGGRTGPPGPPTQGGTTNPGSVNTGGGGGGWCSSCGSQSFGGAGGSGVVILRIATACAPGSLAVAPGTNTLGTTGSCTVATFTVNGTLTV